MLICGLVVGGGRVTAKPTLPQPQSRGSPISTGDNRKIHGYGCIPVKMYKNSSVPDTQEIFPKGLGLPCPPRPAASHLPHPVMLSLSTCWFPS